MIRFPKRIGKFVGGVLLIVLFSVSFAVSQTEYKIMPLGDSITRGVIIGNPADVTGYRDDLQSLLDTEITNYSFTYDFVGSKSDGTGFDPNHEGNDGAWADNIKNNVAGWLTSNPADIVVLHIGTNDITNGQTVENTSDDISSTINIIGKTRKILLCSLIPRFDNDALDDSTTQMNNQIKRLYYEKLKSGYQIYYVGINEVFKTNSNWESTYYSDGVHPNSTGYNIMAQVIFDVMMNAINNTSTIVVDNFNRSELGITWVANSKYQIVGDELANTTSNDWWDHMAVYVGMTNPNQVSIRWSENADAVGITKSGIVMGVNSASSDGDGYLIWRYGDKLTLYEVRGGEPYQNSPYGHIDQIYGTQSVPQPEDTFKVIMRIETDKHVFDCFINGEHDGTLTDVAKRYGNSDIFYAGVMLKDIYGSGNNNNIDDFRIYGQDDVTPPAKVNDLSILDVGATTITLKWTAPGDDANEGTASGYDIRYATALINENNFFEATQVTGEPIPAAAGTQETFMITGLQPNTAYFFAIKSYDEAPNFSLVSNSPSASTNESNSYVDNFNRATLGDNWNADPEFDIVNNELENTATESAWDYMAVFNARANPLEVSFKWGVGADAAGIKRGGLALMLDAASPNASGYLTWARDDAGKVIELWTIDDGAVGTKKYSISIPAMPVAGDVFRVTMSTDAQGHHFLYYINSNELGEIIDTNPGSRGMGSTLYAGVMLHGALNNNIDDFTVVNVGGEPAALNYLIGNYQTGIVGKALSDSLAVSVSDMNSIPVSNVLVRFRVTDGDGHVDLEPIDDNIRYEVENGTKTGTFSSGDDATASNGHYAYTNGGNPMEGSLTFSVYIDQTDYYVIWGRLKMSDTGDKYYSYFVQVDGQPEAISTDLGDGEWDFNDKNHPQTFNQWYWDRVSERGIGHYSTPETDPVEYYLEQGVHTITITQRYPNNIQLDNILLTSKDSGYTPSGKEESPEYYTNSNGVVKAELTLGPIVGANNNIVEVSVPGYDLTNEPYLFYASATPDVPTIMNASSATHMTGVGGQPLANPFEVILTDQYGNPASGYSITWNVTQGNGTLSNGQTSQVVTSDATGKALTILTLGTESTNNTVQATFSGLTPVSFTATATSGIASQLVKVTTETLQGTVNTTLATPLTVRVLDSGGAPVENHPVHFAITVGNGSISQVTAFTESFKKNKQHPVEEMIESSLATELDVRTDEDGLASVTLQLGQTAGTNTVEASAKKLGVHLTNSPRTFTATGLPDVAKSIVEVSGNDQTGAANMPLFLPFVVKVTDIFGNGVTGHQVFFEITNGEGSLSPGGPWFTEAPGGLAQATLTLGPEPDVTNVVEVTAASLSTAPIIFEAVAGNVTTLEYVDGDEQTGSAGWPMADSLKVKVTDNYGNPVGNYPVVWACLGNNGGTVDGLTSTTKLSNSSGISKVEFKNGDIPGTGYEIEARANSLDGSPYIFTTSVADIDAIEIVTGNGQSGTVGSPLPQPLKVKVVDILDKAIPNYKVTFAVTQGNGNLDGASTLDVYTNEDKVAEATLTLGPIPGSSNNVVQASAYRKGMELLTNGDLDEWESGKPVDWNFGLPSGKSASEDVTNARSGSCVKINLGSEANWATINRYNNVTVKANTTYEFSFWAKSAYGVGRVAGGIRDNSGYYLLNDATWTSQTSDWLNQQASTIYTKYSIIFTTRAGVTSFSKDYFRIYAGTTNDIIYVDNISLTESGADGTIPLNGSPVTFVASALIGEVDSLVAVSGDSQYTVVGNQLEDPLVVRITDKCGNAIAGVQVTFEVKSGSGYLDGNSGTTLITKTSNANGEAQVELTVGNYKGEYNNIVEARANRPGGGYLRNSPYRFYATARSSSADNLSSVTGNNQQNQPVRQQMSQPLVVKVADKDGNGVSGHPVTFKVIAGGGTFDSVDGDTIKTDTTNYDGLVSVYYFPGPQAGVVNIVEARSWNGTPQLIGSPVQFSVTPVRGSLSPSASIIEATGPVAADGQSKSYITVTLTDNYGNPIDNKTVIIYVSGSSNSIDQPLTKTNLSGRTTGAVSSTRAELKTVTAYVVDDQLHLTSQAQVRFTNLAASWIGSPTGNNQIGNFNAALKDSISALVTDVNGNAVNHHLVYFEAYQGGGLIFDLNKNQVYDGGVVYTDSSGRAAVYWVLGPSEALNRARAISSGLSGSAEYFAEAHASSAITLKKVSAKSEYNGTAGYTLSEPFIAKVTDNNGDPIYNHAVKFQVTFGGGSIDGESQITLSTDHFGEAQVYYTLGREAGYNTVEVSSTGLSGSPQVFRAVGNSGEAAKMMKISGNGATGTVGGTLTGATVVVTDIFDNVYQFGHDITFSILEGDATISNPYVTTNANGQASATINLGITSGEIIVQAYAAELINNPLKFKVYANAASAVSMSVKGGNNQSGSFSRELVYPLEVIVKDFYNNPVIGVDISFVGGGGNGILLTPQVIYTDSMGIASARYQLGTETSYQVLAIKNGLSGSPITFKATAVSNKFPLFDTILDVSSPENQTISFTVSATDEDDYSLSYEAQNLPSGATFDALSTRRFSWTPN